MQPIKAKLLPHAIPLFNVWKDPESGDVEFHRTILERVRVGAAKTSLAMSKLSEMMGPPTRYEWKVLIDKRTTKGYGLDSEGARSDKEYLPAFEWEALADKSKNWTLREPDLIYFREGETESICPECDSNGSCQAFMEDNGLRTITAIPPVIDKDGSIHHWEIILA